MLKEFIEYIKSCFYSSVETEEELIEKYTDNPYLYSPSITF
jgi:hypothetical protein